LVGRRWSPDAIFESSDPGLEPLGRRLAVTPEHGYDFGHGSRSGSLAAILRIEFISVANDFFFDGQGTHVPHRQGQLLMLDIPGTEADTHVSFTHQAMPVEAAAFQ
jgi:hypothetical protein